MGLIKDILVLIQKAILFFFKIIRFIGVWLYSLFHRSYLISQDGNRHYREKKATLESLESKYKGGF